MSNGSGLFSDQRAYLAHLVRGRGGLSGELDDLRKDVTQELAPLVALTLDEFTNPAAADAAGLKIATATVASEVTVTSFLAPGLAALAEHPRQVSFTTAGVTPADAPATALVTGKNVKGIVQSETVTLSQIAGSASTTKYYSDLDSVVYPAADGAAATVAIGFGASIGLSKPLKSRAGLAAVLLEIMDGSIVGSGGGGASIAATNQATTATNAAMLQAGSCHVPLPIAAELITIVAAYDSANGAAVIAAQPDVPRKLQLSIVEGGAAITAGTGTLIGEAWDGTALSKEFDLTGGAKVEDTTNAFASVTSFTVAGLVGGGAGTTISIGCGAALGLPIPAGAANVEVFGAYVDGGKETVGTVDATARTIAPTTAADAAKTFDFNFRYDVTPTQAAHNHTQNAHAHAPAGGLGGVFALPAAAPPYGAYTPNTAANGVHDYLVLYEYDPTAD